MNPYDLYLSVLIMSVFTLLFIATMSIFRTINEESRRVMQPIRVTNVRRRK